METLLLEFSLLGKSDLEQKLFKLTQDSESQEIKLQVVDNVSCALARELRQGNQARPGADLIRNQLNQLDGSKPVKGLKTLLLSHIILNKASPCISSCLSQVAWSSWENRATATSGGKSPAVNNQKLARDGVFRALLVKYWNFLAARVQVELKHTPANSLQVLKKSIEMIRELDASLNGSLNKRLWLGLIAQQISNDVSSNSLYLQNTIAGQAKKYLALSLDQFSKFYQDYCDLIAMSKKIIFFQSLPILYPMIEFLPITIFKPDGELNKPIELYHLEIKSKHGREKVNKRRNHLPENAEKEDDRETILTSGGVEEQEEQEESKESAKENKDRLFLEQVDGFFNIHAAKKINTLKTDQSFNPMKQLQSIEERYSTGNIEENRKNIINNNSNISQQSKEMKFKQVFIIDRQQHHLDNVDCIAEFKEETKGDKGFQELGDDNEERKQQQHNDQLQEQHVSRSSSQSASGELSQTKSALMSLGNAPSHFVTLPYENEGQLERLL